MSSSAVVTLKLSSEQFRFLHREMEYLYQDLKETQQKLKVGSDEWKAVSQRMLEIDQLLRLVL